MSSIPVVNWRFGEKYYITEFVTPYTYMVRSVAETLRGNSPQQTILNVASFIRDKFFYPLDIYGNPASDGVFKKSKKTCTFYYFTKKVDYMWLFPAETLNLGFGICIDTSLLATSILLAIGIPSKVALGAVYDNKNNLLGYHAWTEFISNNNQYILETTIHEKDTANIMLASDGYKGTYGIRYDKYAEFDNTSYTEYKPLAPVAMYFGKKKKEFKKSEKHKQEFIWKTYKNITPLIKHLVLW